MRTVTGLAAVLVLAWGAAAADETIDGALLVGKWEPKARKKGELASVEFTKDAKVIATTDAGAKAEGTYKLDGNALTFTVASAGETTKGALTLTKLTADELEARDREGKTDAYKRLRAK